MVRPEGAGHYQYLLDYVEKYGNPRIPDDYITEDGFKLDVWTSSQRVKYKRGLLSSEEVIKLEAIAGWFWDDLAERWNKGFEQLKAYVAKNGNCFIPYKYATEDGYKLGVWVHSQRSRKDKHSQERLDLLESIDGWIWGVK